MGDEVPSVKDTDQYPGLPRLLHGVRWTQHLFSIVAEVLILLSFAMSGMDVSLGGVMALMPLLKILWAGMFALGIDTAFALSWVRVRQCLLHGHWLALTWNILLAIGMSIIVFEPISIQLLQQSLNVDFNHAVESLGINIVFLTYARSGVAVFLGAILAMTNVESDVLEQSDADRPRRRIVLFDGLLNRIAPIVSVEVTLAHEETDQQVPAQLPAPATRPAVRTETTPQEREAQVRNLDLSGLSTAERVERVSKLFPGLSDRELGKLSNVSAATAKKYREMLKQAPTSTLPVQAQTTEESSR